MSATTKSNLKKVFSGLSSVYVKKGGFANFTTMAPDWDLPVTVDSFSFSQAEPTLNETKVHGLSAAWTVTAEAGEISVSMTVPSVHDDLVDYFLGAGTSIASASFTGTGTEQTFVGESYTLASNKMYLGLALLSDDGTQLCVIKKIACYATPMFENASTTPFGFTITGSIEASDTDSDNNIAFLTKSA